MKNPRKSYMKSVYVVIFVTCPTKGGADKIIDCLLRKKLIACGSVSTPIKSYFWWKGKIDLACEYLVTLKTKRSLFKKIVLETKRIHPYEVPEIIALPITAGSDDYLGWIEDSCGK